MNIEELIILKNNLDMLANGIEPKTRCSFEDSVLGSSYNKRIFRDASYVIDCLLRVDFNPEHIDKRKKYAFFLSKENQEKISISDEPISISAFCYRINEHIDKTKMKQLRATQITTWLMKEGYLSEYKPEDGKIFKVLTDKSKSIGMTSVQKENSYGRIYRVNLYGPESQKFILRMARVEPQSVFVGKFKPTLRQNPREYVSIPCGFSLIRHKFAL